MAYNFCCDSYRVPNLIYIYYTIVIILGSSMWCVLFLGAVVRWLVFWLLCPLWLYWFSCLLVFRWMGRGWGGVPVHLFFVFCYCSLFWIGCVSSNSAIIQRVARAWNKYFLTNVSCVSPGHSQENSVIENTRCFVLSTFRLEYLKKRIDICSLCTKGGLAALSSRCPGAVWVDHDSRPLWRTFVNGGAGHL